jgi:hypothetical protein
MSLAIGQRNTDLSVLNASAGDFMNEAKLIGNVVALNDFNGRLLDDLSLGWL